MMFGNILNNVTNSLANIATSVLTPINVSLNSLQEQSNSICSDIQEFKKEKDEEKNNKSTKPIEKVCLYENNDELKIYRGYSVKINDYVTIRQPTIEEICDYGENEYYEMVYTLCAVGADLKWQLDDVGIDYTQIDDYDLFCGILSRNFDVNRTSILLGNVIDFSKMKLIHNRQIDEDVLIQVIDDRHYLQIDRYIYSAMIDTIRKMHRLKRNNELPGNEATRQILIEDARDEYEENKDKPRKSFLLSLISALVNSAGSNCNEDTVFNMHIYSFMDSVARIGKIKNAELLLQSGYSGFGVDLKKINKDELNWIGDLS